MPDDAPAREVNVADFRAGMLAGAGTVSQALGGCLEGFTPRLHRLIEEGQDHALIHEAQVWRGLKLAKQYADRRAIVISEHTGLALCADVEATMGEHYEKLWDPPAEATAEQEDEE